jgi:hypothetical protein
MKKILLLSILLSGCAAVPVPVAVIQQKPPNADALSRALANSQIQASQMNQYISGVYGPNSISQVLLDYQNANRELSAIAQNPWNGFFIARNAWVK